MKNVLKPFLATLPMLSVYACVTTNRASLAGECAAFTNPGFAVQGKRRIDQRAVDIWLETGVVTCGWPRPKSDTPR
jgi:hypothetical protein